MKADDALMRLQAGLDDGGDVPGRRAFPRRDPERRRAARPRGGRRGGRGRGHRRQPCLAGQRRHAAARVGAAGDGGDRSGGRESRCRCSSGRARASTSARTRAPPDGSAHFGQLRGLRGLRYAAEDVARAVECGIRGLPDRRPWAARAAHRDAGRGRAARRHRLEDLRDDGAVESARAARARGARRVDGERPVGRHRRAARRAARGVAAAASTSTSSRPTRSAASCAGNELGDLIQAGAPLYAKFGLRNARMIYPSGAHLVAEACAIAREKVHRAAVGPRVARPPRARARPVGARGRGSRRAAPRHERRQVGGLRPG